MALFFFVGRYYLRYFFVILIALEFFFVSIDSLQYLDDFVDSANLIILFLAYDFMYALNFMLPISLLLAMVVCYLFLVKSNQYTALLSIGFSKKSILRPILWISLFFTFVYIGLNATPFAYAQENVEKLFKKDTATLSKDLFVKFNDHYVYFGVINPIVGKAQDVRIFQVQHSQNNGVIEKKLLNFTQSKLAYFSHNAWVLQNVISQDLPKEWNLGKAGLKLKSKEQEAILEGFRPKVLDSIYQSKPLISIVDAIESLQILRSQKADTDKIRALLYVLIVVPLFVPFVAMILAYYMPSLARYGNLYIMGFACIVFALIVWGIFFASAQFSVTGIVYPEIGIIVPLALLVIVALYHYIRLNHRA
ncbi:LptF/LptG family permease [Helicobacter fennelliae]|uniref:Permease YjgP/YjgQ n=2 Tax=Helicobacter fennelliae TaxID=215 RepID=T1D1N4_9HELI|nr:LptF/LptG family permease [Helicobacter fennelliae]GAD19141.1 permease YjgP/YjgQ [Helicobacter fennelliae MRY12-0050]SQB98938.1 Permease [Helicobacter fennelliae]STP08219.1 Permease [Helicobacter fennelliae]